MTANIEDASTYPYSHCPFCGSTEFFVKEHMSGPAQYFFNGDGTEADNYDLYSGVDATFVSKYCYCAKCEMKLFEVE